MHGKPEEAVPRCLSRASGDVHYPLIRELMSNPKFVNPVPDSLQAATTVLLNKHLIGGNLRSKGITQSNDTRQLTFVRGGLA